MAARHRAVLPRHLMAFLTDAHQVRGVLRQVGPIHQFRHIDLQRRLARHTEAAATGPGDTSRRRGGTTVDVAGTRQRCSRS
ncbi:hypothetical protein [Streptomyces sp. NPDC001401]|uniref:hypothetical protein n=1 Tax=Streptomyces sp. NPDC001401 TaxID=3364570 RepID=UPI0036D04D4C